MPADWCHLPQCQSPEWTRLPASPWHASPFPPVAFSPSSWSPREQHVAVGETFLQSGNGYLLTWNCIDVKYQSDISRKISFEWYFFQILRFRRSDKKQFIVIGCFGPVCGSLSKTGFIYLFIILLIQLFKRPHCTISPKIILGLCWNRLMSKP